MLNFDKKDNYLNRFFYGYKGSPYRQLKYMMQMHNIFLNRIF